MLFIIHLFTCAYSIDNLIWTTVRKPQLTLHQYPINDRYSSTEQTDFTQWCCFNLLYTDYKRICINGFKSDAISESTNG